MQDERALPRPREPIVNPCLESKAPSWGNSAEAGGEGTERAQVAAFRRVREKGCGGSADGNHLAGRGGAGGKGEPAAVWSQGWGCCKMGRNPQVLPLESRAPLGAE